MPEQPTTPDLVELVRRVNEATNRREYDVLEGLVTPDVVSGIGVSGGVFGLYRLRDDKVASLEDFTDRDDAVKAAEEPE